MALQVIEHEATTAAPPEVVFSLLRDGSTWTQWSPIGSFELVDPGQGSPEGVGAVRIFRTRRGLMETTSRERLVTVQENEVFSYELLSGLPIRDSRAVVVLRPLALGEVGTSISWRSTFQAKVPGTGWFYRRALGTFIGRVVEGLASYAAGSASR